MQRIEQSRGGGSPGTTGLLHQQVPGIADAFKVWAGVEDVVVLRRDGTLLALDLAP